MGVQQEFKTDCTKDHRVALALEKFTTDVKKQNEHIKVTYNRMCLELRRASWVWWCTPCDLSTQEAKTGGLKVLGQPGLRLRPCLKKTKKEIELWRTKCQSKNRLLGDHMHEMVTSKGLAFTFQGMLLPVQWPTCQTARFGTMVF
jgi:hypothetical protein